MKKLASKESTQLRNALHASRRAAVMLTLVLAAATSQAGAKDVHGPALQAATHRSVAGDTSAIREYKAAMAKMMRNMKVPFTGDVEVDFRSHMIPHHQGAMDTSWVALRHGKDAWTHQAAQTILIDQQQEIAQLQSELARLGAKVQPGGKPRYIINANTYPNPNSDDDPEENQNQGELVRRTWAPGSGVPQSPTADAGASEDRSSRFNAAAIREFKAAHAKMMRNMKVPFTGNADVDYRTHMIPHHQGAIDMARVALRHARNPWTRQTAQAIITAQEREIQEFKGWLARHGAS
jgi:uncharacterized protein (DUF305 family)